MPLTGLTTTRGNDRAGNLERRFTAIDDAGRLRQPGDLSPRYCTGGTADWRTERLVGSNSSGGDYEHGIQRYRHQPFIAGRSVVANPPGHGVHPIVDTAMRQ